MARKRKYTKKEQPKQTGSILSKKQAGAVSLDDEDKREIFDIIQGEKK